MFILQQFGVCCYLLGMGLAGALLVVATRQRLYRPFPALYLYLAWTAGHAPLLFALFYFTHGYAPYPAVRLHVTLLDDFLVACLLPELVGLRRTGAIAGVVAGVWLVANGLSTFSIVYAEAALTLMATVSSWWLRDDPRRGGVAMGFVLILALPAFALADEIPEALRYLPTVCWVVGAIVMLWALGQPTCARPRH